VDRRGWVVLLLCCAACDDGAPGGAPEDLGAPDDLSAAGDLTTLPVPMTTVPFTEITGDILNPERGWFGYTDIGGSFTKIRTPTNPTATPPTTVTVVKMDLDQTQATIPPATLAALVSTASAARTAGVKIILRPVYRPDDSAGSGVDPTSAPFVVSHVQQLGQTLRDQSDVIMVVQLGMLGPWGEFHTSPLTENGGWTPVLDKLLDELPASRMVQVRRPCYKDHFFAGRGPLTDAELFTTAKVARVGHFNDCFLGDGIDDQGTYVNQTGTTPARTVDAWRTYAAADTRSVFVGGETCGNNARASCTSALADLSTMHWSFLGHGWYQPTVGPTGVLSTCRGEITERLGYRLVLDEATHSTSVRPGDTLSLTIRLHNEGFAPLVNPRPLTVVLHNATTSYRATLDIDPRRWAPATSTTFTRTLTVPSSAAAGTWSLSLALPDASTTLRDRADYAVRFANQNTWDAGLNTLTKTFEISPTAVENRAPSDATLQ
jgi:hypothetical protein